MNNTRVNYQEIIDTIQAELDTLLAEINSGTDEYSVMLQELIGGMQVYVNDEQDFVKPTEMSDNSLFVNVHFLESSVNFGGSVVNINLKVLGTANKIKPAQAIMAAFATRWSTQNFGTNGYTQIWVIPRVESNFFEAEADFRTLFSVSGSIIISQEVIKLESLVYKYGSGANDEETIYFLAWNDSFSNSLSPQPFGNTCGYAVSESNFSTYAFTINTYMLDSRLVEDCFNIQGFRKLVSGQRVASSLNGNSTLTLYLTFANGFTNRPATNETESSSDPVLGKDMMSKFKITTIQRGQKLGDIPTITIGFSL
jgi:hypothetical protein